MQADGQLHQTPAGDVVPAGKFQGWRTRLCIELRRLPGKAAGRHDIEPVWERYRQFANVASEHGNVIQPQRAHGTVQ